MASSAVNEFNSLTCVAKCLLKYCDRICTAYSQQSARSLVDHLAQTNIFV